MKEYRMKSKSAVYIVICQHCKKEVKTEIYKCILCGKMFHPSCVKFHKVHTKDKELVHSKEQVKVHLAKPSAGRSNKEAKASKSDGCRTMDSSVDTKLDELLIIVKELKNEMGEIQQLKQLEKTVETIKEEMVKMRQDFNKTIAETMEKLKSELISTIRKEMCSLG